MAPHFIVLLCLFLGSSLVTAQSPGTACDTDTDCRFSITFLKCVPNGATKTCECPTNPRSFFDTIAKQCYRNLGEPCDQTTELIPCTPNTKPCAGTVTTCQCADGFPTVGGSRCVKGYGEQCDDEPNCDQHEYLDCKLVDPPTNPPKKCACDGTGWWNTTTSKCDLRANEVCDPEDQKPEARKCARASTCLLDDDTQNNRICVCDAGYHVPIDGDDGLCYLSPGGSCAGTAANHCDRFDPHGPQVCSSAGTCICKDEGKSVIENGRCKLGVNQACIPGPAPPQICESGAICDMYNETCRCMTDGGFHEYNGRCVASFGAPCKSDSASACGPDTNHLECIDDICQCHPHYSEVTNPNTGVVQCLGNLGASCGGTNGRCREDRSLTCQTDPNGQLRCAC